MSECYFFLERKSKEIFSLQRYRNWLKKIERFGLGNSDMSMVLSNVEDQILILVEFLFPKISDTAPPPTPLFIVN